MEPALPTCVPAEMTASDDLLREQAWLVARGVRSLALVESIPADHVQMLMAASRLEAAADRMTCLPFVLDRGDGTADCGYACGTWALDLYRWASTSREVPPMQADRIRGLLFGYGPEAIRSHEETGSGRRFLLPTASPEPATR